MKYRWQVLLLIMVLTVALAGCAAMEAQETASTEQLLSAAGFKMKLADTPEKITHLQSLTQRQLVPHTRDGQIYYAYADANSRCLYVGDEQAYQRYQQLAAQERIAEEQRQAAEINMDAAMNWEMWGPWDPWW